MVEFQVTQHFEINEDSLQASVLNSDVASMNPISRIFNYSGSEHVHVDINNTAQKMFPLFDNRGMIAVSPRCDFSFFSMVVFLAIYGHLSFSFAPWRMKAVQECYCSCPCIGGVFRAVSERQ